MKRIVLLCLLCAAAQVAWADVYVLDSHTVAAAKVAATKSLAASGVHAAPGNHAASVAGGGHTRKPDKRGIPLSSISPSATGSQTLIDASGLQYFINTNITFSTTSSASGAMSEASYTHAVAATTSAGGTTASTLNDAFDGYNTVCLSADGSVANCETGNANFTIYNRNGPATQDATCNNRQILFPVQTVGSLAISRKVYVPTDDSFGRWLNIVTNNGATAQSVTLDVANNLGSDNNTIITATSSGDLTADASDTWVASFQNYSGNTSSDPREGHVLQGPGASAPLAGISFVDGNDNPFWGYTFSVPPGQTRIIMNFVTALPSKAAAAAQAARLAGLPPTAIECMTPAEQSEVVNFNAVPTPPVPTPGPGPLALSLLAALLAGLGYLGLRARAR